MIVLRSDAALARIDTTHGAELVDFVDLRTGRQLFGRPPFGSLPPLGGDLDEQSWSERWRGGWQTCLPNYGAECEVEGTRHGFHGRASNDPWEVAELRESVATLAWRDAELAPVTPPADAPAWPEVGLIDGSRERAERWRLADERSRLYVVRDVGEGRARVRNPARGQAVELEWDVERLPHVVVWHEARGSGGLWRRQTELLCIEPCSVPHEAGLAAAVDSGGAWTLAPGERLSWWTTLRSTP